MSLHIILLLPLVKKIKIVSYFCQEIHEELCISRQEQLPRSCKKFNIIEKSNNLAKGEDSPRNPIVLARK